MRALMFVAVIAACGGGSHDDPHELVECSDAWGGRPGKCERACAGKPKGGVTGCSVTVEGVAFTCAQASTTEFDGEAGCCVVTDVIVGGTEPILFAECE